MRDNTGIILSCFSWEGLIYRALALWAVHRFKVDAKPRSSLITRYNTPTLPSGTDMAMGNSVHDQVLFQWDMWRSNLRVAVSRVL